MLRVGGPDSFDNAVKTFFQLSELIVYLIDQSKVYINLHPMFTSIYIQFLQQFTSNVHLSPKAHKKGIASMYFQ